MTTFRLPRSGAEPMTDRAAVIQGDFVDTRRVKSRSVLQVVFEVPIEMEPTVMATLGWPSPGNSLPCAIARLAVQPKLREEKPPLTWDTMSPSQRAAVKLNDKSFCAWLVDTYWTGKEDIGDYDGLLKRVLGIQSKRELDTDHDKSDAFEAMLATFDNRTLFR